MNNHGAVLLGSAPPPPDTTDTFVSADVWIEAQFSMMTDRLDLFEHRVLDHLLWERQRQPINVRMVGSAETSPAGFAVIDCGAPVLGWQWDIVALAVGRLSTVTTAPGRCDTFVSKADYRMFTSLAEPGLTDWRDFTPHLPNVALYRSGQVLCHAQEHLYVVISGGAASQMYVAAMTVEQRADG